MNLDKVKLLWNFAVDVGEEWYYVSETKKQQFQEMIREILRVETPDTKPGNPESLPADLTTLLLPVQQWLVKDVKQHLDMKRFQQAKCRADQLSRLEELFDDVQEIFDDPY
jgi:cell division septation protein DedD